MNKQDAIKINPKSVAFAKSLIDEGKINQGILKFTAEDGNKLLGPDGNEWDKFAIHHMVTDPAFSKETKNYYKFPFSKMVGNESQIFRRAVIAIKTIASGGRGFDPDPKLAAAADNLLEMIDNKLQGDGTANGLAEEEEMNLKINDKKNRIDFSPDGLKQMMDEFGRFKKMPAEGFMKGDSILTNVGVFPYQMIGDDGNIKIRWELRSPAEVFDQESMESLKMLPITNEHPETMVNSDNVKKLIVGYTGDNVFNDSYHLGATLKFIDEKTIRDIANGKRGVSCGYTCDVVPESGVWMGVPYDAIQKNIRYNHLAVVDKGRAGDAARMKLDSAKNLGILKIDKKNYKGEDNMNLKTIKIDGVEYQAEADVIKAVNQANQKIEQLRKDISEIQAKADTLEESNKSLKQDLEKATKLSPEKFDQAVKERIELIAAATNAGVEVKTDMSDIDIKKAIVISLSPAAKEKLDNANDTYINARYDLALEQLKSDVLAKEKTQNQMKGDVASNADTRTDASKAREKMINNLTNRWKGQEG